MDNPVDARAAARIPLAVAPWLLACGSSGRAPREGGDAAMDRARKADPAGDPRPPARPPTSGRIDRASGALAPIAGSPFSVTGLQPEIALTGGRRP